MNRTNGVGRHTCVIRRAPLAWSHGESSRRLCDVNRVVVCGSGARALERAETLRHRDYQVTHLMRGDTLWSEVLDPVASDLSKSQPSLYGMAYFLVSFATSRPVLFLLLALALGIKQPYGHEGFLMTVLPSGPIGMLLATRYNLSPTGAQGFSFFPCCMLCLMFSRHPFEP
jgi:hypothetical protein